MSNTQILDRLREERDTVRNTALALVEADDYDPNSDALRVSEERGAYLDGQIGRLAALIEAQAAADALDGRIAGAARRRDDAPPAGQQTRALSWGETFVRSAEFTDYRGRGQSAMLDVDWGRTQHRALPTGIADMVAAGLTPAPYQVDLTAPQAPTPLLDNVTKIQVSSNAIEYVSWAKIAGGAAKVAEKAAKPSAEWKPTVTSSTLDNIAVYTQLTRQLIEDYSAVRDMIDQELRRDVTMAVEADAAAVIAAGAASIPDAASADDLLSAIRIGIGVVQAAGYMPTAILLNPADYAALDLTVFAGTLNGPTIGQSFWGLRPIPSTAQAAGTAIVGDFRAAVQHYFRSQVALYITDSHADTFLSNVFTLLAEQRSKTALVRPQALAECTGPAITP